MSNRFVKKILVFISLLGLSCIFTGFSLAFAKEVVLGGENGWNQLDSSQNITTGIGRFGYDCIQIDSNSFDADEFTDFLVSFENNEQIIDDGYYNILQNNLQISNQTINGKSAGLSRNTGGLTVKGENGTFFGTEGLMGSFSIEFWLCPSIVENGEIIFDWETSKIQKNDLIYQKINASFDKGKLVWSLSNI